MTVFEIILKSTAWALLIGAAIFVCFIGVQESSQESRDDDMCCDPDFDYETGLYVHEANCEGMTFEQWGRR